MKRQRERWASVPGSCLLPRVVSMGPPIQPFPEMTVPPFTILSQDEQIYLFCPNVPQHNKNRKKNQAR